MGIFKTVPAGMFLATGEEGEISEGNFVRLFLLVDEEDGVISDCKYQCYGNVPLIAAMETLSDAVVRKNYDQARRITPEILEKEGEGFPVEYTSFLVFVLSALDAAIIQCLHIPLQEGYIAPPTPIKEALPGEELYPNWLDLNEEEKMAVLVHTLDTEIRPYLELDEGGAKVVGISDAIRVLISYSGACSSCYSSIGATLNAIQNLFRQRIYKGLIVEPDLKSLHFE